MDHSMVSDSTWTMAIIHFFTMIAAMIVYDLIKAFFNHRGH